MADVVITKDEITDALTRLSAALSDMTPAFQDIGEILIDSTKQRFGQGIAPDGSRWAPKSPVTLAKYGARSSNRIDVRPLFGPSGALSSQIFYEAGRLLCRDRADRLPLWVERLRIIRRRGCAGHDRKRSGRRLPGHLHHP